MSWNDIHQAIGMLQQQDVRNRQKAYYDEQAQASRRENAEAEAVNQNFNAMAQRFREAGGDFNALMPLVRDGHGMKALARLAETYAQTEEARKKGADASIATGLTNLKQFSEAGTKAAQAQPGSEEWQTWTRQAAALSPVPVQLGAYDPQTNEFEMVERDQFGRPAQAGRVSGAEAMQRINQALAGNVTTKDGRVVNNEYLRAFLSREALRRSANPAAFADPATHTYLQKGGKTLTVIPQINANPALDRHFVVVDPERGATVATDLDELVKQGWTPTSREQMNTDTKYALDAAQVTNQSRNADISAGNLALSQRKYADELGGNFGLKDQSTILNTTVDNLRARQNDILKQYASIPQIPAGANQSVITALVSDAEQKGIAAMREKARSGDAQAQRDLEEYSRNEGDYRTLMSRGADLAFGMTGGGRQKAPAELPGEMMAAPAAPSGVGSMRGKVGGGAPSGPSAAGARQPSDGRAPRVAAPVAAQGGQSGESEKRALLQRLRAQGLSKEEALARARQAFQK